MASSSTKTEKVLDPKRISRVKIFPPIGIARVGDSGFDLEYGKPDLEALEYFLPPEIPGRDEVEVGRLRYHGLGHLITFVHDSMESLEKTLRSVQNGLSARYA